jgi:hypothetical protein
VRLQPVVGFTLATGLRLLRLRPAADGPHKQQPASGYLAPWLAPPVRGRPGLRGYTKEENHG